MSAARSASGEGFNPSRSSRAMMKLSIGVRGQAESVTGGSGGRSTFRYDQCPFQTAP